MGLSPYAHMAAGYHQHCPTPYHISTAAENSCNLHAQRRATTLNAKSVYAHDDATAITLSCVDVAYRG
jgi:hypothetical protein